MLPSRPHADRGAGRALAVEPGHHLVGKAAGVGRDGFVAEEGDLVFTRAGVIVSGADSTVAPAAPGNEQLDRVRPGACRSASEPQGAAAKSPEPAELRPFRVQHPNDHVHRDLVDFAEDEVVFIRLDRVAGGVAGGQHRRDGATAAQFGGLGGEIRGGEQRGGKERQDGEEGSAEARYELAAHQWAPIMVGGAEGRKR